MASIGPEINQNALILDKMCDNNGKYLHILNRVFYRKIPITKVELDNSDSKFQVTIDLSNLNIDSNSEMPPNVLWDCFHIRKAFNEFYILGRRKNMAALHEYVPLLSITELKNISESNTNMLKQFLMNYGYPFTFDEDDLAEYLSSNKNKIIHQTVDIKKLLLDINTIDETFLIYVFLMQNNQEMSTYQDVFCGRSEQYESFYTYYKKHGKDIIKRNIRNVHLTPVLELFKQDEQSDKKMYYHWINQNPIDAALHHILLLISNDSGHRIKRCASCHEYFLFEHDNRKYCGQKGCTRQNAKNKQVRQKNKSN